MKDSYVYEGTNVLINKAGFKEQSLLDEFESTMTKIATINLSMSGFKYQSVQDIFKIHKQVFEKVYDWAGQPRTINIYKSEYVLNGLSVTYCDYKDIKDALEDIDRRIKAVDWTTLKKKETLQKVTRFFASIWRVHAFREGNTRTVALLLYFFLKSINFKLNNGFLSEHAKYFRNALVLASIDEYSEYEHLEAILSDSISFKIETKNHDKRYQTIKGYDLSKYQYNYHSAENPNK